MQEIPVGMLLCIGLLAAAAAGLFWLRRRARQLSQHLFGTDSLAEGYALQRAQLAVTPKSVCAMTRVYLPQIAADFPEFDYPQVCREAESLLKGALLAISTQDPQSLHTGSEAVRRQVEQRIADAKGRNEAERFENITIHRTEIARYLHEPGICTVLLQSAVGYYHYVLRGGELVSGSREELCQTRYETAYVYVQDASKVADAQNGAVGITCPNCGAPITTLGQKTCAYCGLAVEAVNIHSWTFQSFEEVL